jgi:hypothetical protein
LNSAESATLAARPVGSTPELKFSVHTTDIARRRENAGRIICRPILGGLHHQYGRM